ncbi:hypothetical protein BGW36DRAFT_431498 [Talaromyces proteolyticus]|uniref:Uncharacterized protein n=1 Tax=Talaromyces proteolyticus TaxID=1131652 RepID=A0AAD4PWC1_9EURO|nr:uncharacterized protein BGW36DRAFT_431498 [Talaromyces proteolyticus]KAH8692278.1 hypothetical protein BGW36DRAFT_431498 [Talaromyces proteolyticus]
MSPKGSILVTGAFGGLESGIISELDSYRSNEYHGIFAHRPPKTSLANSAHISEPAVPMLYLQNTTHKTLAVDLSPLQSIRKLATTINQHYDHEPALQQIWEEYKTESVEKVAQGSHMLRQHELQRRFDADPTPRTLCVLCVDPGIIYTARFRHSNLVIRMLGTFVYPVIGIGAEWVWPKTTFRSP